MKAQRLVIVLTVINFIPGAGDRTRTDDLRITRTQSSPPFE